MVLLFFFKALDSKSTKEKFAGSKNPSGTVFIRCKLLSSNTANGHDRCGCDSRLTFKIYNLSRPVSEISENSKLH